ncbi:hypothetical protein METBIDRAFT_41916 [Metschnikowia bicuspidata var. bicuspidata NRRL YB-4993]|uniref:Large ribosomal subunit protein uL23m n=1 Tax=Metschnikowia bicuspidata var. bicuspidata NRRL YB-4993 TaxID=869754 RepID=A0A1A0HCP7_9ASCO|nr:hypothetical protein METBIDRAFT_41916 [Metschnikowia bicuspidata var. bicuspidata NRRL YB-4993]OBA21688.1 hypothetical protein METBIDRAFT_41916 [Metschnikowia bicuspidata var. bicuspidata NRRL YB-4993]
MDAFRSSVLRLVIALRSIRHKPKASAYPKVNVQDVVLDRPRYGFRKVLPPLLSQSVQNEVFPAEAIRAKYLAAGKPVPLKFHNKSDAIARRNYDLYKELVALGLPHFRVGEKKVYLPKARVCLLRPNAKHTPYQAKFLVPRNFNKMDLRDYLWHVYGLRALNVTVQLLHARFMRNPSDLARYRGPQYKKMTIDMEEPFVWPALPDGLETGARQTMADQMSVTKMLMPVGSEKNLVNDSFDGLYAKPQLPDIFVSKKMQKALRPAVALALDTAQAQSDRAKVAHLLNI